MKNFSTSSSRLLAAAMFCGVTAVSAHAKPIVCEFKPNAPDSHTVVKGDTLWDISGTFLDKPWCWPQVWGMNKEEIANPHWIYPGQIVWFDREAGRLRLGNKVGGDGSTGDMRLGPQLRTEGLGKEAVRSIPSGVIEPFLTQPLIIEDDEMANAPRILATRGGHVFIGKGDKAYVRGDLKGGTSFQVFRPGKPLKDPLTQKVVAQEAFYLGTLKLETESKEVGGVHTFVVAAAKEEMGKGDMLMAMPPMPMQNYVPHPPEVDVHANVLAVYNGVTHAGQNQVVSINRGKIDGLDVGAVLQLYHRGDTVTEPGSSTGRYGTAGKMVKLPDEEVGSLFIFRVFKHVSYGLIMQVTEPIVVGDVAKTAE
ncbi:LysM peptidoglycan-binding domain-containing protein [Pseudoduganella violaceinigra]|uniref:LysM peptidoglycan-binding domain-containing protein n=1 Tax=Pseudoduganella violaceinigra TaxID=246602 RepID=UPI000486ED97|nr:LysM peptidoglycan-binding domain-containing protein [Pseudoduganella violaceinigra]